MPSSWSIAKGVARTVRGATDVALKAGAYVAQEQELRRGRRAAASGVLAPGDPSPPPGAPDCYDYRGVALARELIPLRGGEFSLGRWIDPRRGPRHALGLPRQTLTRHAAVVGPSGSGKTLSILLPWTVAALRAGASVVAVDAGGDLLDAVLAVRARDGALGARVATWDYADPRSMSWDWLGALRDDDALAAASAALLGAAPAGDPRPRQRDDRTLRGLLETMRRTRPQATVADMIATLQDRQALAAVRAAAAGSAGARRLAELTALPPHEHAQAIGAVVDALDALDRPDVRAVSGRPDLDLDRLFDVPSLLVVGARRSGGRTSAALASLLLSQIVRVLGRRAGGGQGTHVLLALDEAPRLAGRVDLEELLSVARRASASVCLAAQDVADFGDARACERVLGGCATYVSLPSASEASARYLASRLGQRQQAAVGVATTTGAVAPQRSVTRSSAASPVLGVREVTDPPWGPHSAVVHVSTVVGRPFLVDLARAELP
jgi:type IV secretory pathway TraG/TraD family ATPase VirD4